MAPWLTQLLGGGLVDKVLAFIPNPAEKEKARTEMQSAILDAAIKAESGQRDINKGEAANPSLFVAGGRPAVIWLCVFGLGWQFFLAPMFSWFVAALQLPVPPLPLMSDTTLTDLLYALLGISTLRTADKVVGGDAVTKGIGAVFGKK